MVKVTVTHEFNLPEENPELRILHDANHFYSVLWDIRNYIRSLRKYDEREVIQKEEVIDKITDLMNDIEWGG